MKNLVKEVWIIALVVIIEFSMIGCNNNDNRDSNDNIGTGPVDWRTLIAGTWVSDSGRTLNFTIGYDGKVTGTAIIDATVDENKIRTAGGICDYIVYGNILTLSNPTGMVIANVVASSPYYRR